RHLRRVSAPRIRSAAPRRARLRIGRGAASPDRERLHACARAVRASFTVESRVVASSSFTFSLEFDGPGVHVPLLERLADALLNQLGCSKATVAELTAALERALANGALAKAARCDVRFQTQEGMLHILVSADGG